LCNRRWAPAVLNAKMTPERRTTPGRAFATAAVLNAMGQVATVLQTAVGHLPFLNAKMTRAVEQHRHRRSCACMSEVPAPQELRVNFPEAKRHCMFAVGVGAT
jgi:hypothetical protein